MAKETYGNLTIQAKQVQKYAEKKLRPLFDKDLSKLTSKNTSEIRAEIIEANSVTKIEPFIEFFENVDFSLAGKKYIKLKQIVDQYINSNDDQITASVSLVVDAYNNLVKDYNKDKGVQISHAGINVIAKHLFLLYTYLQLVGDRSITLITSAPPSRVEDESGNIIGYIPELRKERINPRAVAAMAEEIRQLYIMSIALLSQPIQGGGDFEDLQSALANYFKTNDQKTHLATKVKVVDILSGTVKQELIFEEADTNKRRAAVEYLLGTARNNALQRRARRREIQQLRKTFAKDFDALSGSKRTNQELGTQVRDALTGKKPKRSASTTKAKGKKPKKDVKKFKVEKAIADLNKKKKKLKTLPKPSKLKRESGEGDTQRELNRLRAKINRSLPAEVRRNMGRPRLENQSGTFSNSVEIVSLRKGKKTIIGEYTYMRTGGGTPPRSGQGGVYETFERMGVYANRWPVTYNPKPLITMSIRNLAKKFTDAKFTLRRI
tara:strand:+ start:302 stop:1780 length:1479 start_codon:yes stop_codon:yes gene_type:complete